MLLSACNLGIFEHPGTNFKTLSAKCKVTETPLVVQASGNTIVITASLVTPTPCYKIKSNLEIKGTKIVVRFEPKSKDEVCVQCIGEIVGTVSIHDLPSGIYSVTIQAPDSTTITTIRIEEG